MCNAVSVVWYKVKEQHVKQNNNLLEDKIAP